MIIKKPVVTEKTVRLANSLNQYTFEVANQATKHSAAEELQSLFQVEVVSVQVQNRIGKTRRFGTRQRPGRTNHRKTMLFTLKEGQKIDLFVQ